MKQNHKKVVGIGGWLMFYFIGLLWGIIALVSLLSISSALPFLNLILIILELALIILSAVFILMRYHLAPPVNIISLWAILIINLLFIFRSGQARSNILPIILGFMGVIIWTIYFYSSKRVSRTFAKNNLNKGEFHAWQGLLFWALPGFLDGFNKAFSGIHVFGYLGDLSIFQKMSGTLAIVLVIIGIIKLAVKSSKEEKAS
jgi:hypothetical protein